MKITTDCIGMQVRREWTRSWQDYILYALGVGAGEKELEYLYEKDLKILPTFATLPYNLELEQSPFMQLVSDPHGILHASNELTVYHPMPRKGGTFHYVQTLVDIHDLGPKGSQFVTRTDLYDEQDTLLASCTDVEFSRFDGGWGGPPRPADTFPKLPDRDPDRTVTEHIPPGQYYLYRLSGDYFPLHADPEFARAYGFEKPIMHGLCTYGYVCRMAIGALFPGQPERLTNMKARFKSPLFADRTITLQLWDGEPGQAFFRLIEADTGAVVVDKGELRWKPE